METGLEVVLIFLLVNCTRNLFIWTIWSQPNHVTYFLAECPNFKVMYLKEINIILGAGFLGEVCITGTVTHCEHSKTIMVTTPNWNYSPRVLSTDVPQHNNSST